MDLHSTVIHLHMQNSNKAVHSSRFPVERIHHYRMQQANGPEKLGRLDRRHCRPGSAIQEVVAEHIHLPVEGRME